MIWVLLGVVFAVGLVVVAGLIGGSDEKLVKPSGGERPASKEADAKEIADEVKTIAQFRSLERKMERAGEAGSKKFSLYQEALDIVGKRPLAWQLIPEFSLTMPLEVAEAAYQVVPAPDFEEWRTRFPDYESGWHGIDGYDEPDDPCDESKFVVKFRRIVESPDLTEEEQGKKINSLVSRNANAAENFFDLSDGAEKPSVQWISINK